MFFSRKAGLDSRRKNLNAEIGQEIIRSGIKDAMERIKTESRRLWQAKCNLSTKGCTMYSFFKESRKN